MKAPAVLSTVVQGAEPGDETSIHGKDYGFPVVARVILTFLLTLAFAGLVPSSLAAPQEATSPAGQTSGGAGQSTKQGGEGDLATITQSRSTNTRAYKVLIHNDGSAIAEGGGPAAFSLHSEPPQSQQFPPGTVDTKTLRRLLAEVGDVSRIPAGNCAKSASFGTRTEISYAGRTSGDLQCVRQQASGGDDPALLQAAEELSRFVQTTLGQLKTNSRRSNPNQ
jgi:hypothetical protein